MNTSIAAIDFPARLQRLQSLLKEHGVDVLVGTRLKTITHLSGAFVPWRSALIIPATGTPHLYTVGMDSARLREESVLTNVSSYARIPLMDMVNQHLSDHGLSRGVIAVEDGYSLYVPEGTITHEEYQMIEGGNPGATLKNMTEPIDHHMLVKDSAQIHLMRQASSMCDAAQIAVAQAIRPGMSEIAIAGVAEGALREAGSEFAWTFTGGQEIGSGHRSWTGACTPPTNKLTQRGETVVIDLHGMYGLMLGDVSHNAVFGKPTDQQRELMDAYVQTTEYLLASLRPGRTIGDAAKDVREFTVKNGWGKIIRGFGHGIGHFGNEWFPSFTDVPMRYVSDPEIVMEPGFMEVMALTCNQKGVGGFRFERPIVITDDGAEVLSKTDITPWTLD
jgi:Xaa-Pro aminopeptidase